MSSKTPAPPQRKRRTFDVDVHGPKPPFAPPGWWNQFYGSQVPAGTLDRLLSAGLGPLTFPVGRLKMCSDEAWCAWGRALAETGGVTLGLRSSTMRRAAKGLPRLESTIRKSTGRPRGRPRKNHADPHPE